jgi:hypothetical protein
MEKQQQILPILILLNYAPVDWFARLMRAHAAHAAHARKVRSTRRPTNHRTMHRTKTKHEPIWSLSLARAENRLPTNNKRAESTSSSKVEAHLKDDRRNWQDKTSVACFFALKLTRREWWMLLFRVLMVNSVSESRQKYLLYVHTVCISVSGMMCASYITDIMHPCTYVYNNNLSEIN